MELSAVAREIANYAPLTLDSVRSIIYDEPELMKYLVPIEKVDGKYMAVHALTTGSVVMGFRPVWDALGEVEFVPNELTSYNFKVNHPVKPADMKGSWYSLNAYNSRNGLASQPISDYIVNKQILPAVLRDMNIVHGKGVYNPTWDNTLLRTMNGLIKLLTDGTTATTGKMYRITLPTITSGNIVSVVEEFEDKLPSEIAPYIDKIYMSRTNKRKYMRDDRAEHGKDTDYSKDKRAYTYEDGREIIGLRCLDGSDLIFCTPNDNFLGLCDSVSMPGINDVQYADYIIKIFMEWEFGIAFHTNQLVFVGGVFSPQPDGLDSTANTAKYYPSKAV